MGIFDRIRDDPLGIVRHALTDPMSVLFECNRAYHANRTGHAYDPDGIKIFEENWDNCIILDACRYDWFERITPFNAPVETRQSRGSATKQLVRGNFTGMNLTDTVYVSSNWWFWHISNELNCEIHDFIRLPHDFRASTYPETVIEAGIEAANAYPEKRLLIHYMQPHRPYLGYEDDFDVRTGSVRGTVRASGVSKDRLVGAYVSNLADALKSIRELVNNLDGKTVITADHGELLGERTDPLPVKWYGHPHAVYVDLLTTIPWQVVTEGPRRTITTGEPTSDTGSVSDEVETNLRQLGYIE